MDPQPKTPFKRIDLETDDGSPFVQTKTPSNVSKKPVWLVMLKGEQEKKDEKELYLTSSVDWHQSHISFIGSRVESVGQNPQEDFDRLKDTQENLSIPTQRIIKVKNVTFVSKK